MITICKEWYAWIDRMPPPPRHFHVIGGVTVGNPGVEALLTERYPAGINPAILMLDLTLNQRPGQWITLVCCAQVRYDETLAPNAVEYTDVEIFHAGARIASIKVDIVS